jgi:S-DNA-T family DNA segregation ATPase FtsK/SpoIIIE
MVSRSYERRPAKKSLGNEVLAVVMVALAILLLLSLVTYDPKDLSWNSVGPDHAPANLIGQVGAHVSDFLLQMFGLASFAIPILLGLLGVRYFFSDGRVPRKKLIGSVLMVVALSGFLALFPDIGVGLVKNARNGGAGGYLIKEGLASLMNTAGAAIVLTAATILTLVLAMEVSLSGAVQIIGRKLNLGDWQRTLERSRNWWIERRIARRARVAVQQQERLEQRRVAQAKQAETAERSLRNEPVEIATPRRLAAINPTPDAAPRAEPAMAAAAPLPAAAVDTPTTESNGSAAKDDDTPPARRLAVSTLRARAQSLEHSRAGDPDLDPDVAEMVATASIVRTVPSTVVSGAKLSGSPKHRRTHASGPLGYALPSLDLLEAPIGHHEEDEDELRERATTLAEKCKEFAVTGHIHRINPGPVVTTFEFKPDPGIKYSRVVSLAEDLCLALKAESIRIDRIPGKSTVGIEVPNSRREKISLREVIESPRFQQSESRLTVALGETINGDVYVADLARMPHLLIAGATGAGKSVTLNSIICSILYKSGADEVKFIMVDPKRLELGLYEGIPHLLTPIVTDPKRAANALKWATNEMERRYRELAKFGVRNIDQYNAEARRVAQPTLWHDEAERPTHLPYIVIAIDELADLMMIARGEVETSIARLAQMARAVGIHLIVATQRPSVDIITGVIKANFPSRIAFRVSSKVDSRTIIDANGAETLLGQGDMLFLPPASSRLIRVHGCLVTESEVKRITDHSRNQAQPDYNDQVTMSDQETDAADELSLEHDELYDEALTIVIEMGRASTSVLQRRLSIGYGRAAKILDVMEREGFIGPAEGAKPRRVLPLAYEFRERLEQRLHEPAD